MGGRMERRILDNGFTVLTEERGLGPVVFSGVVYRVGSRDERPGVTGISHLLEHMMFKGTEKYGKGDVAALVERNGGELNAFTSEDVTMYYEVFARDRWKLALEIEAERMVNLRVDQAELDSERQVVLEERAMYLDIPAVELGEELSAAAFRESPYRWPIIGWEADIRGISRDDLVEHYQRYYAPSNAALIVVGDVTPDEVFRAAEEHFGGLGGTPAPATRIPREPDWKAVTRLSLDRPVHLPQFQLMFRAPEIATRDAEILYFVSNLLSGTRTSRLDMALLETNKASDVQVQYHAKADPGALTILAEGSPGVPLEEVENLIWSELDGLAQNGPRDNEMERVLNQVEAHHLFANQSPSNRGFSLGWHEAHGDAGYADRIVDELRSVTPDEIRDLATRMFQRNQCAVGRVEAMDGRAASGHGARGAAEAAIRNWNPAPSGALRGGPPRPGDGLFGPGCPRRRFRTGMQVSADVRRLELPNGLQVTLQSDRTDPVVAFSLLFNGGSILDDASRSGLAAVSADTLERGSASVGFPDFARQFESIGSDFSLAAGAELVHGNSTFLTRHLETGLGFIADLLEDPGYRESDLEVVRTLALNDLAAREDDLDDLVDDLFFTAVAQGHPYSSLAHGTRPGLEAITRDDLLGRHAEAFRPDRAHLAIVGDFDDSVVERLLMERFGRMPRPQTQPVVVPPLDRERKERSLVLTRTDKAQAKIVFGGPGWSATDPDRLAGVAMNHVLGGSSIRSRLGDEIRDRQGLAYSVSSRNYERSAGGYFLVHMGTRPENVRKAVDAIRRELDRMASGVTDSELDEAKAYLTGSFPLRFTTYGRLARHWTRSSFYGLPEDSLDTYVDRVRALTADDVRQVAARLVGAAGTLAVAGPVGQDLEPVSG